MGGALRQALDMAQVNAVLAGMRIPPEDWPAIHDGLAIMEDEALAAIAEQAN